MNTIWRYLQVLALGAWVGSFIFFGFFVAPVLFSTMKDMDQAGTIVGLLIWRLHILGIAAAVVYLVVAMIAAKSWKGLVRPASLLVIVMLLITLVSQLWLMPAMDNLRLQMGSYMNTAATNPLRLQFNHLHLLSTRLEGSVFILGLIALFLTVWQGVRVRRAVPSVAGPPGSVTSSVNR